MSPIRSVCTFRIRACFMIVHSTRAASFRLFLSGYLLVDFFDIRLGLDQHRKVPPRGLCPLWTHAGLC